MKKTLLRRFWYQFDRGGSFIDCFIASGMVGMITEKQEFVLRRAYSSAKSYCDPGCFS